MALIIRLLFILLLLMVLLYLLKPLYQPLLIQWRNNPRFRQMFSSMGGLFLRVFLVRRLLPVLIRVIRTLFIR